MRMSTRVGTTIAALLLGTHTDFAQHEGHGAPSGRGVQGGTRDVASLATLLKQSDGSLRAIERAVEETNPRLVGASLEDFLQAMDGIEAYFEVGGDPGRTRKDATKTQRALDATAAAADEAAQALARAGGHHGGVRGSGCGHH